MNTITLVVFLSVWPFWLAWELVLLWKRSKDGPSTKTISMVARDFGRKCCSIEYVWAGLSTHFWWTAETYAGPIGTVAFWVIAAVLVAWDVAVWLAPAAAWHPFFLRARNPLLWLVAGALAGRFLFPQAAA